MSDFAPSVAGYSGAEIADCGFGSSQNAAVAKRTAGALLRDAREAAGLHIAALAVSLKIPVNKLEALEQDRIDLLPDAVFARALASSVCRTLKLDATQVLERLPPSGAPKLDYQGAGGINAPFRSSGDGAKLSLWTQVSRPTVLAGLAFLLGALVLIFLPAIKPDATSGRTDAAGTLAGADFVKAPFEAIGSSAAVGPFASVADLPDQVSVFAPTPTAENATAALSGPALAASPLAQAASTELVTFRAQGESWVEVTDAKGQVVLRRILAAGEVASASGALPLAAVVGRANAIQVQVRGQAFDLTEIARNNVARFEVK